MPTTVVCDSPIAVRGQEDELIVSRVGVQWSPVTENHWLSVAQVLVLNLGAVGGSHHAGMSVIVTRNLLAADPWRDAHFAASRPPGHSAPGHRMSRPLPGDSGAPGILTSVRRD